MSGLIPIATFAIPAMAGGVIMVLMLEFDRKTAFTSYLTVSFLSMILVADKEAVLMFIFLFGQYPIVKSIIERNTNKLLCYLIKFTYFNVCVISAYLIALKIIGMGQLIEEFEEIAFWGSILLLGMGNITFLLYDYTLTMLVPYYFIKIKPRLK